MNRALTTAAAAVLITALACAPARVKTPEPARAAPDVEKRAQILMAEDRREPSQALRTALADSSAEIRAMAVRAVGRIGAPDAKAALVTASADPAAAVRAEASFGLGQLGDSSTLDVLVRLTEDAETSVRRVAADALGRLRVPSASGAIGALLRDPSPDVRAAACLSVWKQPDAAFALERLFQLLRDRSALVRFASAYSLARISAAGLEPAGSGPPTAKVDDPTRKTIREFLRTVAARAPEPETRMQAARGLVGAVASAERAALVDLLKDADLRVRIAATRAFGVRGTSIDSLREVTRSGDVAAIQAAIEAMGRSATQQAVEQLLWWAVYDKRSWLRESAVTALASADPGYAAKLANGFSKDEDPAVRAASARALAASDDDASREIVARLLADADVRVQAAAVASRAGTSGSLGPELRGAPDSADPAVREAVARIAGQRLSRGAAPREERDEALGILERLWARSSGDAIPLARLEIMSAAARAGREPRARALLAAGLEDPDRLVRIRAIDGLRSVHGEEFASKAGPAASRPLQDYVRILRWAETPRAAIVTVQREGFDPGRFTLALDPSVAPLAAWNFWQLAEKGFYNGLAVHRVVPNFVVQDGDPRGDGNGDPGYSIRDEFSPVPFGNGTFGMATDGPDTAGSQWFVTLSPQPHLDGRYTVIGNVVQNFEGVVLRMLPGDRIVEIRVYEGRGDEPLPPLP